MNTAVSCNTLSVGPALGDCTELMQHVLNRFVSHSLLNALTCVGALPTAAARGENGPPRAVKGESVCSKHFIISIMYAFCVLYSETVRLDAV